MLVNIYNCYICIIIYCNLCFFSTSSSWSINGAGIKRKWYFILSKFHYKVFDVKRDDVVAFSDKSSKYLIKRIIGIPGDNLEEYGYETIPEDMYFVLVDNLDDSLDSRDFGLISKSQIMGKPYFKIWPIWEFKFI